MPTRPATCAHVRIPSTLCHRRCHEQPEPVRLDPGAGCPRPETEDVVLQLVSLIKGRDVDRVGDKPDLERAGPGEPTGEGSPVPGHPPVGGPAERMSAEIISAENMSVEGRSADDRADAGMSTVEYAVGTVAAAAFAAVLYQIVTGGSVLAGLTDLINRAMSVF